MHYVLIKFLKIYQNNNGYLLIMTIAKKILLIVVCLLSTNYTFSQKAKYVFYFIGDGMGVNQVLGTEMFQSELEGNIGIKQLCFTQFPVATLATTFSATNGVTDSAAAGTALATGNKTKNGAIGVLKDLETPVTSVASWAKKEGCRVGIATNVCIDDATPSSFYAHRKNRGLYYEIGTDLFSAGFDFYSGSDFREIYDKKDSLSESLYDLADKNGYVISRGYDDFKKKYKSANKMILFQTEPASKKDRISLPYAIDKNINDLSLENITQSALDFLSKDLTKGFFLMIEGAKIDWACHSNDAATVFREVQDFDKSIKIAYDFYTKHPDETLIVVTADHETGGIVLGTGNYKLNLQVLKNQKVSENGFTKIINNLRYKYNNNVPWSVIQNYLKKYFGFWDNVNLTLSQEKRLKDVYENSFKNQDVKLEKSLYTRNEPIASEAKRIINEIALIGWTSGGHSAGYVPVFVVGAGSENFKGRLNNIDIPIHIAKSAGYIVK